MKGQIIRIHRAPVVVASDKPSISDRARAQIALMGAGWVAHPDYKKPDPSFFGFMKRQAARMGRCAVIRSIDDYYRAQLACHQADADAEAWLESRAIEIYTEDTRPENIMKTVTDAIGRIYDRDCEGEMDAAIAAIFSACGGSSNEAIVSAAS